MTMSLSDAIRVSYVVASLFRAILVNFVRLVLIIVHPVRVLVQQHVPVHSQVQHVHVLPIILVPHVHHV